jgi:hypothetical protein
MVSTRTRRSTPTVCEAVMLTATLTRSGTITAADITLTNRTPTLALCRARIDAGHFSFYNSRRPHSSLDRQTLDQAYFTPLPQIAAA